MRNQAEARGQTLTENIAADLPDARCDKGRIVQALSNLLGNAIKFTPEGGAITVSAHVPGDELVVTVSDTGPGIPAEYLSRVFDRYWQAEDAKSGGSGLGLAIVKGIAEALGGRAWAESRLGSGSAFHMALPIDA
jgi:signal transduction histidine kinase